MVSQLGIEVVDENDDEQLLFVHGTPIPHLLNINSNIIIAFLTSSTEFDTSLFALNVRFPAINIVVNAASVILAIVRAIKSSTMLKPLFMSLSLRWITYFVLQANSSG